MRPLWNSHPQGILGIVVPLPMDALAICEKWADTAVEQEAETKFHSLLQGRWEGENEQNREWQWEKWERPEEGLVVGVSVSSLACRLCYLNLTSSYSIRLRFIRCLLVQMKCETSALHCLTSKVILPNRLLKLLRHVGVRPERAVCVQYVTENPERWEQERVKCVWVKV